MNPHLKKNKYHNKKSNGFDSKKEKRQYQILKMLEKSKVISDLRTQVTFELQPSFKINDKTIRAIKYIADFVYIKNGIEEVADCKGYRTKEYMIKRKMFAYKYGKEIVEL